MSTSKVVATLDNAFMKKHYYEVQNYLLENETHIPKYVPNKAEVIDVSDIEEFKVMINDIRPYEVFYRTYTYSDKLASDIAYAIIADCSVTLAIDCIDMVVHFDAYDDVDPSRYGNYKYRQQVFDYINEQLRDSGVTRELEYYKAFKEKIDELNLEPKNFSVTDEVIEFIETWAPAYGIPIPKFYDTINSNERDLPRQWIANIPELKEKCSDFKKSMSKWDCSGMKVLKATSLRQIKAVFDNLQFYRKNDIPVNDNYKICKHCGKPYRLTNIADTANNRWVNVCNHCDSVFEAVGVDYCTGSHLRILR